MPASRDGLTADRVNNSSKHSLLWGGKAKDSDVLFLTIVLTKYDLWNL